MTLIIAFLAGCLWGVFCTINAWRVVGLMFVGFFLYLCIIPSVAVSVFLTIPAMIFDGFVSLGRGDFEGPSCTEAIWKIPGKVVAGIEYIGDLI